ncbi:hypothetical protein BU17DRAFT_101046 [Hysterangium stoloniferum]|nr:hypothetical protein BU17DRAFT_101046 [Hysterangium stoloniferum]
MASPHTSTYFSDSVLPLDPSHTMCRLWRQLWEAEAIIDLFDRRHCSQSSVLNTPLFWVMKCHDQLAGASERFGVREILIRNEYLAIIQDLLSFSMGMQDSFPISRYPSGSSAYSRVSRIYPMPVPPNSPAFINPFSGEMSSHTTATELKGAVIVGHPGIGKSVFIFVFLVLRLQARLPTIYQTEPNSAIFFTDSGVFEIKHPPRDRLLSDIDCHRHRIPPLTWCLVDSTGSFEQIPSFITNLPCFIIQAAPPQACGLKWKNTHRRSMVTFVMQPWSLHEVIFGATLQLSTESLPSEEELMYFYERFGASARECYKKAKLEPRTKAHEVSLRRSIAMFDLRRIQKMFEEVASLGTSNPVACELFSIAPGPRRTDVKVDVSTRFIYRMLRPIFMMDHKFSAHRLYQTLVTMTLSPRKFTLYLYRDAVMDAFTHGGQWPIGLQRDTEQTYLRIGCSEHTLMLSKELLPENTSFQKLQAFEYDPEEDLTLANGIYRPKYEFEHTYGPFIYDIQSNIAMVFHTMVAPREEVTDAVYILLQSIGVQNFFDVLITPTQPATDISSFRQPASVWEGPMDSQVSKFHLCWDPIDLQATSVHSDITYVDVPNSDKGDRLAS